MEKNPHSPILLLTYRRLASLKSVMKVLGDVKPPRLYISSDGPKEGSANDSARVLEVRKYLETSISWKCEVFTKYNKINLGCKMGVVSALDWFFENEAEGIIIEDDVLPSRSFFPYAEEMLQRYREHERHGMVCGYNPATLFPPTGYSYNVSRNAMIWGWGSWRRVWDKYDAHIADWPEWKRSGGLSRVPHSNLWFRRYWSKTLDDVYHGRLDTWDHQLAFTFWKNAFVSLVPQNNLVDNLGFTADATHTRGATPKYIIENAAKNLSFPLKHPPYPKESNALLDKLLDKQGYRISALREVKRTFAEFCKASLKWKA